MREITRKVIIGKSLTFSIDERVFSKLGNKFGMITCRNINDEFQQMYNYGTVCEKPFFFDSTRRSKVKWVFLVLEKI